ncbi:hypothetical protein SERLADRAFT_491666 [Serpula lacrymans var. lacrymans S7.9]|uniref:Inositol polyphosphate-related phosphatase domain-containing protein n=1 Tax=Serpula lacrymans var. lacrymans (strain S7.9) TaxID=578457 RepID=F8NRS0_SERL9|nr:uncharacterized protein SERLADRAFT_491666 [Serpula lacrymans var. lacrymans S7.9]EGO27035.1 hypothetical protein SERLADRAFT_491666 [Serpula lacrymans var. lacrymans S7.9]
MGYDAKRKPAWTDRILHMSNPLIQVKQLSYVSHPEITLSDHRPVSGEFDIQIDNLDNEHYGNAVSDLFQEVAGFEESETPPRLKLEATTISLGKVSICGAFAVH